jgi:gamma-glutamylcyclotransferase (GGCT)/AIG2-like uncharacterized protein YtfP
LFVYGSLRRGERHHGELRGARFLGEFETMPGYGLTSVGEYRALVPDPTGAGVVRGELFEIDSALLPALDEFEGDAYLRRELAVRSGVVGDESPAAAVAYFLNTG